MTNFLYRVKRAAKAAGSPDRAETFTVEGRPVTCPHCGSQEFTEGSALLNTRGRTLFGFDWADQAAYTLICSGCGRIEWFVHRPVGER